MMQNLSISRQTFKRLRDDDCIYVDKTEYVDRVMNKGGFYFLARPRRFGKSLFLSTLKELAEGNRPLFKGTWIDDKWDWTRKHPVINLEFAGMAFQGLGLDKAIQLRLFDIYKKEDIAPNATDLKQLFYDLIQGLYKKTGTVVILIDEYDKPILDAIEDDDLEKIAERQKVMKTFYSVLKGCEEYIHCTFITGITKFAKVSIFSDLNHLKDLTFDRKFAAAYGYTQVELETNFADYIQLFLDENDDYTKELLLAKIKDWYNGYSWDGTTRVYNPFGLIHFFDKQYFINSWFESATPTFLIKKLMQAQHLVFDNTTTNVNFLDFRSVEHLDPTVLMFQAGYLTIKELDVDRNAVLDYPNREVRESMYHYILTDASRSYTRRIPPINVIAKAFHQNDMRQVEDILHNVFEDLAYDAYSQQSPRQIEAFYHSIINILFRYVGMYVQSEVHTTHGRADTVVETATHVYIFEFKINQSSAVALTQIQDRNYAKKYESSGKKIVLIGSNFSTETRYMDDWALVEWN